MTLLGGGGLAARRSPKNGSDSDDYPRDLDVVRGLLDSNSSIFFDRGHKQILDSNRGESHLSYFTGLSSRLKLAGKVPCISSIIAGVDIGSWV